MSDAAILTLVSGLVTISTMVFGFLTLWVKLRYGAAKAEEAVVKAEAAVIVATQVSSDNQKDSSDRIALLHKIDHQTNGMAVELAEARKEIANLKQQLSISRLHEIPGPQKPPQKP